MPDHDLCTNDDARLAVLRMLAQWHDSPTAQQLHDDAHVRPLPTVRDDHGTRKPADVEEVTCNRCGDVYQRPVDSDARWLLCRRCASTVRQRAARLAREYAAWCRQG